MLIRYIQILGLLPLGTSLCTDSPRALLTHLLATDFAPSPTSSSFSPSSDFATVLVDSGFGPNCPQAMREFWTEELKKNYAGEEGRKRIRMATINLVERDGLELRAGDVRCPVLWMHVSYLIHLISSLLWNTLACECSVV